MNGNHVTPTLWNLFGLPPPNNFPVDIFLLIASLLLMISQQGTPVWYWNTTGRVIYAKVQSTAIMSDVRHHFVFIF